MTNPEQSKKTFEKAKFYTLRDSSVTFIAANIAPYAVAILIMLFALMAAGNAEALKNSVVYEAFSMLASPIGFAIVFFAYNSLSKITLSAAKVKFKLKGWEYAICVFVALISVFGCQFFINGVDSLLVKIGYNVVNDLGIMPTNAYWYIFLLFALSLCPAIFEELVFRGIILNGLRERFGEFASIFISGAMFALMHGSLQQLLYPFMLGVVLGWIATRTGSTFASMLVHFLNNAIVVTMSFVYEQTGFQLSVPYATWGWPVAIVLLLATATILFLIEWYYYKGAEKYKAIRQLKPKEKKTRLPVPTIFYISLVVGFVVFAIRTALGFLPA